MTNAYRIAIPHFWCLEYYEGNKKMTVDIDFRDPIICLNAKLISCWDAPFENEIITDDEKRRIIKNITNELKKRFTPETIVLQDIQ